MRNILSYKVFERAPEFADELNVVFKCRDCGHLFSPGFSAKEMEEMFGV